MGLHSRCIVPNLNLKDDRFPGALKSNKSHKGDDSFAELVNLQDHILKCAESHPLAGDMVPGSTREAAKNKLPGHLRDMCCIMAVVIRPETFDNNS